LQTDFLFSSIFFLGLLFCKLEKKRSYIIEKKMITLGEKIIKEELKNLNINSINVICKSCLNKLTCVDDTQSSCCSSSSNGDLFKYNCINHGLIENEKAYFFEIDSNNNNNNNKIEKLRQPTIDLNKRIKKLDICFSIKNNYICKVNEACIQPHTINELNVWELLRRHKLNLNQLVFNLSKWNNETIHLEESSLTNYYSISDDLRVLIQNNDLNELKSFLVNYNQSILFDLDSNGKNILFTACDHRLVEIVQFLTDFSQLSECFNLLDYDNYKKNFINHKDLNGETALSSQFQFSENKKKKPEKLNQISILFFQCDAFDINEYIGTDLNRQTIFHRLVEQKNLKLIQYICFNTVDQLNTSDSLFYSLISLSNNNNKDNLSLKINETLNACLISKLIKELVTNAVNLNLNTHSIESFISNQDDENALEFSFRKIKYKL